MIESGNMVEEVKMQARDPIRKGRTWGYYGNARPRNLCFPVLCISALTEVPPPASCVSSSVEQHALHVQT